MRVWWRTGNESGAVKSGPPNVVGKDGVSRLVGTAAFTPSPASGQSSGSSS